MMENKINNVYNSRTAARLILVQLEYMGFFLENDCSIREKISYIVEELEILNYDSLFLAKLIENYSGTLSHLDQKIIPLLGKSVSFDRFDFAALAILRAAIFETIYMSNTPKKVIINEYTSIAALILDSKDINLINALLDSYIKNTYHDALENTNEEKRTLLEKPKKSKTVEQYHQEFSFIDPLAD